MRTPDHLKENQPRLFLIRRWASHVSEYYGGASVVLVGSALSLAKPRDWDFRVIMPADEFARRYASARQRRTMSPRAFVALFLRTDTGELPTAGVMHKWSREMNGVSEAAFYRWTGLYTDFQVQPIAAARTFRNKPRWRAYP